LAAQATAEERATTSAETAVAAQTAATAAAGTAIAAQTTATAAAEAAITAQSRAEQERAAAEATAAAAAETAVAAQNAATAAAGTAIAAEGTAISAQSTAIAAEKTATAAQSAAQQARDAATAAVATAAAAQATVAYLETQVAICPVLTPTLPPTPTPALPQPPTLSPQAPMVTSTPACPVKAQGRFAALWQRYRTQLGCPDYADPILIQDAEQAFENGQMFWRADTQEFPAVIYVIYEQGILSGTYQTFLDGPVCKYRCPDSPPQGLFRPVRGFGEAWCCLGGRHALIGWGLAGEQGFGPSYGNPLVQDFKRGSIFRDSEGAIYVFFADGTFLRDG
jgi:hypothetical protein